MSKKKPPTTIEECNAEMELTQKKIRQYENRNKMLDRKLAIEKRKERLCQVSFANIKFSRLVAGSQPAMISDSRSSSALKR